jgi:hypothetical protein
MGLSPPTPYALTGLVSVPPIFSVLVWGTVILPSKVLLEAILLVVINDLGTTDEYTLTLAFLAGYIATTLV